VSLGSKCPGSNTRVTILGTRFCNDDNDRAALLEGFSLLVAAKKRPSYQIVSFISFFLLVVSHKMNKFFPDFHFPDLFFSGFIFPDLTFRIYFFRIT
jgi:hypothetical protein